MKSRYKMLCLGLLVAGIALLQWVLSNQENIFNAYSNFFYVPFQNFRNQLFYATPTSIGDIFYASLFLSIICVIIFKLYLLLKKQYTWRVSLSQFLNFLMGLAFMYLFFILSWGANYNKKPLSKQLHLATPNGKVAYTNMLLQFDSLLVAQLNMLAPQLKPLTYSQINLIAAKAYSTQIAAPYLFAHPCVKQSLLSTILQKMGIEGYYNPFTGEAQVSTAMPACIMPFVLCHEMAHQYGIAAEDDANLLAYIMCQQSQHPAFAYAAYLDTWCYVHYRLLHRAPQKAQFWASKLNHLTLAHIHALEQQRKLFDNIYGHLSSNLYDAYLKMNHQKDGLKTYGNITTWAWAWQQQYGNQTNLKINLP